MDSPLGDSTLRARALEQIRDHVKWFPQWGQERLAGMVENRPDWCISRQRLWGVPITVLYCDTCNEPVTTPAFFDKVREHFLTEGADAWYERPAEDFLAAGQTCAKCGNTAWRKEKDILDVWFDSGCSHLAVLRSRDELTWPAAMYIEGHDQHRGWFQSSLLVGTGLEGAAPYQNVVTCGFIVNEKGEKLSKSSGNALSAQDVIKQNGADILRMWVTSIDYRDDLPFGPELIGRVAESYRKIRNTARFLLANLHDFEPEREALPLDQLLDTDTWALARAAEAFARCRRAYDEYEFHLVYHRILELCTVDLSAVYIDVAKDTIYCDGPDSRSRRSAQTAMYEILRGIAGTIAPVLSFTAEEIYEAMPGAKAASVHLTDFPAIGAPAIDAAAWERIFRLREVASAVLERARNAKQIGKALEADITLHTAATPEALLGSLQVDLSMIFLTSHVDFKPADDSLTDFVEFEDLGRVAVSMSPARGRKCGRCWLYREEVAGDGELCARCQSVVDGLAPEEMPTI
jgi:isoleucyl-tRNA synthetase